MKRRHFLQQASAWLVPFGAAAGAPKPIGRFDDVDHFERAHALRDGRVPALPSQADAHCDVVVVGGGVSGLAAAWRLRGRSVVVLEKEPVFGGNSRSGELAGCRHSIGAFLSQGPIEPFAAFFDEIGAEFIRLQGSDHAVAEAGRLVRDPLRAGLAALPWPAADRAALRGAVARLNARRDGLAFPMATSRADLRMLDERTQWAQYDAEQLPPRVRQLFDTLIAARTGDSGENLSAFYGNYLLANVLANSYTMRGGHGDFTRRLLAKLQAAQPQALHSGFTVLRVENRGGRNDSEGVLVAGIDAEGRPRAIAARCAVIASPKHLTKHLVPGLRSARASAYDALRYNAYLVAQVSLKRRVPLPFETLIADARLAKYAVAFDALPGNARQDGGGLLTMYAPFPRVAGRAQLLAADARDLAKQVVADLKLASPEAAAAVDEVRLQRWGHPMLTATPRMGEALDAAQQPEGRIVFAHSDKLGLTGLYSALWAGMEAEADVEVVLA